MELSIDDVEILFQLIAGDDGRIDPHELVHNVQRLKGTARSMDLLSESKALRSAIHCIPREVKDVLHPLEHLPPAEDLQILDHENTAPLAGAPNEDELRRKP